MLTVTFFMLVVVVVVVTVTLKIGGHNYYWDNCDCNFFKEGGGGNCCDCHFFKKRLQLPGGLL